MARRQKEIFAHNNPYEKNIFKRFGSWFGKLQGWQKGIFIALLIILVVAIAVGSYVFAKLNMMDRVKLDETELSCVDVDGYINILLLGVDTRDMNDLEGAGADAIMILSIKEETGEVNLISVYRDTYLKMGNDDYYTKITDGNRIGGPQTMIQSLNQAMDMNISKFAVVNFKAVSDLVNAVGGIEVDVQDVEISQLNKYTIQTANNIGQKNYQLVKKAGTQTLEGVQAVSYGRIRKGVGDDYKRTERMRIVLTKVFEKVKTMSIGDLDGILNQMLPQVQTNLSNNDIFGLAARLAKFNINGSTGWPYTVSGGYIGSISYVFPADLASNTTKLHQEMFGQADYTPSETVLAISNQIISIINNSVTDSKPIDTEKDKDKNKKDEDTGASGSGEEQDPTVDPENPGGDTPTDPSTPGGDTPTEPTEPTEPSTPEGGTTTTPSDTATAQ